MSLYNFQYNMEFVNSLDSIEQTDYKRQKYLVPVGSLKDDQSKLVTEKIPYSLDIDGLIK